MAQAQAKTYWNVGKLISQDILKNKNRADYGDELLKKLSDKLTIDVSTLQRSIKFYETYPRISAARPKLDWTHYRALITVEDKRKRDRLEVRAKRQNWHSRKLEYEIKRGQSPFGDSPFSRTPLAPRLGTLGTYTLKDVEGTLEVDCGFDITRAVNVSKIRGAKDGTIVQSNARGAVIKSKRAAKDLFTYEAIVLRVVDGDTLVCRIDCGFNTKVKQILRLRGINAPETDTDEGAAAKRFVQSLIKIGDTIVVRTSTSDKFDRYLADVFVLKENRGEKIEERTSRSNAYSLSSNFLFLNNELLAKGHAVRY